MIRRTYNRLGLSMLAYILIYQLFSLPVMYVVMAFWPQLLQSSWFSVFVGEFVQYLVAMPVAWLMMRTAHTPLCPLTKRRLSAMNFLRFFLVSVGLMFLFNLVGTGLNELISMVKGSPAGNIVEQSISSYTLAQSVLLTVVSAPIGEELVFRKWIYRCVGAYGSKAYILTSSCMFMLMHGNIIQYPYAFAVGAVFAWVYLQTGSIWTTILLHAAVNFVGGVLPLIGVNFEPLLLLQALLYLFCAAYAISAFWKLLRRKLLREDTPSAERSESSLPEGSLDAALLNPGMLLFTVASFTMAGYVILYL